MFMNDTEKIRIMIVEDHFVVRAGLTGIINSQPDMLIVAEAGNGTRAVELYEQHEPDVTLMDLRLPSMNGTEASEDHCLINLWGRRRDIQSTPGWSPCLFSEGC
jgi:CheY-like chemotaxis protein